MRHPNFKVLLTIAILCSQIATPMINNVAAGALRIFTPVQGGFEREGQEVRPYASGRLLIKLKTDAGIRLRDSGEPQIGIESLDALGRELKVKKIRRAYRAMLNETLARKHQIDRWYIVELSQDENIPDAVGRYAANPNVETATPDWRLFTTVEPNDPLHQNNWGHDNNGQLPSFCWFCGGHDTGSPIGTVGFDANAENAWAQNQGYGDPAVVIAILDTGVDLGHPDLRLVPGWDYGSGDSDPSDDSAQKGHGTACAGIAAAIANNGIGADGIAGGVSIMPLKVANASGAIFTSAVQNALYRAASSGVDIVSMSFGAPLINDPATDTAIQYAYNNGVTLFAATGNDNAASILYPANNPNVIAVGAASPCGGRKRSSSNTDELNPGVSPDPNSYTCDGERWWGANYGTDIRDAGSSVDIIAPTIMPTTDIKGVSGYSADDYYKWFNGTSAAAPYAAGVAALMLSANPTLTPSEIRQRIVNSATDVVNVESENGWDRYSGYGMINAAGATGYIPLPSYPAYGRIRGGDQSHADGVYYVFEGQSGDILLEYEVWDIDFSGEVQIAINGVEIKSAPVSGNDIWGGTQTLIIPDNLVKDAADNYLTFTPTDAYLWGVRRVSVDEWNGAYPLPSYAAYGRIKGGDQSHADGVNYVFEGQSGDILLEYEVWDIDFYGEVQISLNGVEIGFASVSGDEVWGGTQTLIIPDNLVKDAADNYLTFTPTDAYLWGVRRVSVDEWNGAYPLPSYAAHGRIKGGDQSHADGVKYVFEGQSGDTLLEYEVWDIDFSGEVQIALNGVAIGFAPVSGNEVWGGIQTLVMPDNLVNDAADNYLTFTPTGTYLWGVRFVSVPSLASGDEVVIERVKDSTFFWSTVVTVSPVVTEITGRYHDIDFDPGVPQIDILFNEAGGFGQADFNGFRFWDWKNTIAEFKKVSIWSSNIAGFDESRIAFNGNNIYLNFEGLAFSAGSYVSLQIND
jgi:subtilisin family serine protease